MALEDNINPYAQLDKERSTAGWPWRLFTFVGILFVAATVGYFGLQYGYRPFLKNQIRNLDQQLSALGQSIPDKDQEEFITFYSQLLNLQSVLGKHVFTSALFPILEANTHTGVTYTGMDISIPELRLSLEGSALSYSVLGEQLTRYDALPQVTRYTLTESQASDGRVKFRVLLFLNPDVFKGTQAAQAATEENSSQTSTPN